MYPTAIKFFDFLDRKTDEFDAYDITALIRDGVAVLEKGGSVHFDLGGRAFFYNGCHDQTREAAVNAFRSHLERVAVLNKRAADARMWFVMSTVERGAFWSNKYGWSLAPEHAEIFSEKERNTLNLPMDGMWVEA